MQTLLIYVFALLVVGGLLFLAASFAFGRGEEMAPALPEGTPVELPDDRPATGADLRALRLAVVLRGYRMEEVDWVLDRLAEQVDARDREIARLRSVLHVEPVQEPATEGAWRGSGQDGEESAGGRPAAPAGIEDATGSPAGDSWRAGGPAARPAPSQAEPPDDDTGWPAGGSRGAADRPGAEGDAAPGGDSVPPPSPALGTDDERLTAPEEPVPVRAPGDGSGPVPVRDRLAGPGNNPVRGLRPDGGTDRDRR